MLWNCWTPSDHGVCVYVQVWFVRNTNVMTIYSFLDFNVVYFFVDLVKCIVLTLVSEIWHYEKNCYYYYSPQGQRLMNLCKARDNHFTFRR